MNSEAHARKLEDNLAEANARLAEMERTQTELNATKIHLTGESTYVSSTHMTLHALLLKVIDDPVLSYLRLCVAENNDLSRELEDVQSKLTQVTRLKASLASQIDELKRQVDEENKV